MIVIVVIEKQADEQTLKKIKNILTYVNIQKNVFDIPSAFVDVDTQLFQRELLFQELTQISLK